MKFLSQLFEARGTVWKEWAFRRAFLKLVAIYLLIIALIISIFSWLVVFQVENKLKERDFNQTGPIHLTEESAREAAIALKPDGIIEQTNYEIQYGTLLYSVKFSDESTIEFDMFSGEVIPPPTTLQASFFELITDEINETIWLLGGIIFLAAGTGAVIVARITLNPIAESVRQQNQFVSDAAHELKNPLAALKTTLQTEQRASPKDAFSKDTVLDLITEVDRLIATTESLLKLEHRSNQAKSITTEPERVVSDIIARLEKLAKGKNLAFKFNSSAARTKISQADIETILYNLLHNAVKFAEPDSTITVTWEGKILSVHNTGEAIPATDQPYIFDRFYKVEKARTQGATPSSGLGLAIVKSLLEKTGSTIAVTSHPSSGTTFTVKFA